MRIDSCTIGMDSARLYTSERTMRTACAEVGIIAQGTEEQLMPFGNMLTYDETTGEEESESTEKPAQKLSDTFEQLKTRSLDALSQNTRSASDDFHRLHQLMFKTLFHLLFGSKGTFEDEIYESRDLQEQIYADSEECTVSPPRKYSLVMKEFTSAGYYSECESTRFNAKGVVNTADGRSIDINLNISMSRTFSSYYEESYTTTALQKLCDPLVVNFDGNIGGLEEDMDFYFDLDMDGEEEKIARLTQGSGFLALDLNGDGVINDGSELFGPKSGNGFKDLAAYDEDGNGWIDEGDSVFEKLKIWSKDPEGNDILYTLKETNIGALYTGAIDTRFSLNDTNNATRGYVRQTGLFLFEDGTAGAMQHIDMVS